MSRLNVPVQPSKPQISLSICAVLSQPLLVVKYSRSVKLLTEHHLEFLSLKGGRTGSSESTLVKTAHCWKSHVKAHIKLTRLNFEKDVESFGRASRLKQAFSKPCLVNLISKDTHLGFSTVNLEIFGRV